MSRWKAFQGPFCVVTQWTGKLMDGIHLAHHVQSSKEYALSANYIQIDSQPYCWKYHISEEPTTHLCWFDFSAYLTRFHNLNWELCDLIKLKHPITSFEHFFYRNDNNTWTWVLFEVDFIWTVQKNLKYFQSCLIDLKVIKNIYIILVLLYLSGRYNVINK